MSVAASDRGLEAAESLDFSRTVDRTRLHRRNLTEVFVTDVRRVDQHSFVAAALLPVVHPHYTSHVGPVPRLVDPMLLLECCRQAETYAAHALFEVEMGAAFVLRNWSAQLSEEALRTIVTRTESGPKELRMVAFTSNPRWVRDKLCGLDYEFHLWVSGIRIGQVRMEVGYLAAQTYAVIRSRRRAGPPPLSSDEQPSLMTGQLVGPALVGRINATDVLLLDVLARSESVTAALRIPLEHISFFDHAQDHVPGMVLVEAARQIAALATEKWGGGETYRTTMLEMESSFSAYAELDEAITMTAKRAHGGGPGPMGAAAPAHPHVEVTFHQAGTDIARVRIAMAVICQHPVLGPGTGEVT